MYMMKHGMKRNRRGGGVLNLTSTTTVAMNKDGYKNDVPTTVNKKRHGYCLSQLQSFSRVWKMSRTARVIPFLLLQRLDLQREDQEEVNPLPCCGSSDGDDMEMNTKMLLNGISCKAKEGEMNGLSWSKRVGKINTHRCISRPYRKREPTRFHHSKRGTYVKQDDLLFPMLTVEETLIFSAEFRLPSSLSKKKKQARAQALIDQLGLRNAATTVIGDEGHRGVSGGERRRVSIGIDIIHDPIVLFLDEPTSGLDSTSAYMPSYIILGLLDKLLFLSRGNTVYSGSPTDLPRFFSEYGHIIPEKENKTEFALDLIRELEDSPEGTKSALFF
ncbi:unnamed protein product [Brassica napus]|uniref:(rape) hypothetical protein n=1 Tax=Brassica napus TaxID=3708 RepID=A0A816L2K5_BRANA|nr:unnamed protein product [Brassica napus]